MAFTSDLDSNSSRMSLEDVMLPKVITLCGSTRFMDEFARQNEKFTLAGNIVFSVAVRSSNGTNKVSQTQKTILDQVHFHKIRMSDEIFVINCENYIGDSTKKEIDFARSIGRKVTFLHEPLTH